MADIVSGNVTAKMLWEYTDANAIASYYEQYRTDEVPMLGPSLFPNNRKRGLSLEWIKGQNNRPIALMPAAFDDKPPMRDRGTFETESTEMPFFREGSRFGEADRIKLTDFLESHSDAYAKEILKKLYDDTANLIVGASVIPEIERISLLKDATIKLHSTDTSGKFVKYDYNYDLDGSWATSNTTSLTAATDKWSDYENSDPVEDIKNVVLIAKQRGLTITRAIVGYNTMIDLYRNKKLRMSMSRLPNNADVMYVTEDEIRVQLKRQTGVSIAVYDRTYLDVYQKVQFYYPQRGQMTLMTSVNPGRTWYGTTPEELDAAGVAGTSFALTNTGVAVCTKKTSLPINIVSWVSEIVLPTYENMHTVFNIKY